MPQVGGCRRPCRRRRACAAGVGGLGDERQRVFSGRVADDVHIAGRPILSDDPNRQPADDEVPDAGLLEKVERPLAERRERVGRGVHQAAR